MRQRLYRWWLYRGPGLKKLRRALRIHEETLPPGFEMRSATFTGKQAIEAEHEVACLREMLDDASYFQRGDLRVKVMPVVKGTV